MARRKTSAASRTGKKRAPRAPKKKKDTSKEVEATQIHPTLTGLRWLPWQDRFLAQEVYTHRPFESEKGKEREAWDVLAEELKKDSAKQGPKSVISRNGEACRVRMARLVEAHRVSLLLLKMALYLRLLFRKMRLSHCRKLEQMKRSTNMCG